MTVQQIIKKYQDEEIFIEILADAYKLEGLSVCWRGVVTWKVETGWISEDVGCHNDWDKIFKSCVDLIENFVLGTVNPEKGMKVIYTPSSEEGIITSWNDKFIFVDFNGTGRSIACNPNKLKQIK